MLPVIATQPAGVDPAAGQRLPAARRPHASTASPPTSSGAREYAESSPSIVTPLNKYIGYEEAAKVAKQSLAERKTIRQVVLERGYVERGDAHRGAARRGARRPADDPPVTAPRPGGDRDAPQRRVARHLISAHGRRRSRRARGAGGSGASGSPATQILWRYRENGGARVHIARPVTVVRDDEELLAVWMAPGHRVRQAGARRRHAGAPRAAGHPLHQAAHHAARTAGSAPAC